MQFGMVGLGRMGAGMTRRLRRDGHDAVVYDPNAAAVTALAGEGATGTGSLADLVAKLAPPRLVWVMVPAGAPTEQTVTELGKLLGRGDVVVDGGNSYFKDDVRRAAMLAERGIDYLDVGTSGGIFGFERGFCLMVGGPEAAFARVEPVLASLAPGPGEAPRTPARAQQPLATSERGYVHCGPNGAGHFVKMVHNGIEYGLMQAYAEGFDILLNARSEALEPSLRYELDLTEIAEVWRRGSVISSWLLDLAAEALCESPGLDEFSGRVEDSGEGRWTVEAAVAEAVPATVLTAALYARFRSRQERGFGDRLLSALRRQFGGHVEAGETERAL